jgi:cyclopropane fatty-acyl-phospholipid synthase-like methyltransferase
VKPETTEDILELLQGYITSATVGAAMELGLFWLLVERPLSAFDVAESLNIPLNRCHHWLQLLSNLGLLEDGVDGYAPSIVAQETILNAQSRDFWAFHAREDRDRFMCVRDLAVNIGKPMSAWEAPAVTPPDYCQQIRKNPSYAARFTRMLYEIHIPLAEQLANLIDLQGVNRLMDLGGGSGVVSFALLRKQQALTSVVLDVESVCQVGREIASENRLEKRISYMAADLSQDDLPIGFDMAMLCDVGLFSETLFRKIHDALNTDGHLVVVDKFAPTKTDAPPSRLSGAFVTSLQYPAQSISFTTVEMVQSQLQETGFRDFSITFVPHDDNLPWNVDWMMLEARKQAKTYKKGVGDFG